MQTDRSPSRSVQILTAVHQPESGPAGIGVTVTNGSPTKLSHISEQGLGSSLSLHLRSILRALQLARKLRADDVSILSSCDDAVKLVNREVALEPGSPLFPLYMRIRALMHTFRVAEVLSVSRSRVEPARRLAVAASRTAVRQENPQGRLFSL